MPPLARSKKPLCCRSAPVKLPRSWPKSSLSMSCGETAPQLSGRKALVAAPGELVNGLRRQLLAGAALPDQHDRGRGRRHAGQLVVEHLHALRAAEDAPEAAHAPQLIPQLADLVLQRGGLLRMPQHRLHALQVGGLDQIIAGAGAQRGNGAVDGGMAGDDDDFGGFRLLQLAQQLDSLSVRQRQIGQQHIGTLAAELDAGIPQALGARHGKPLHAGHLLQPLHHIRVVVDDQSMCHVLAFSPCKGRSTVCPPARAAKRGEADFFSADTRRVLAPPSAPPPRTASGAATPPQTAAPGLGFLAVSADTAPEMTDTTITTRTALSSCLPNAAGRSWPAASARQ